MSHKIKKILNVITANGMRELTDERLNQFAIAICEFQKSESASEIKDINYELWLKVINSKNVAE